MQRIGLLHRRPFANPSRSLFITHPGSDMTLNLLHVYMYITQKGLLLRNLWEQEQSTPTLIRIYVCAHNEYVHVVYNSRRSLLVGQQCSGSVFILSCTYSSFQHSVYCVLQSHCGFMYIYHYKSSSYTQPTITTHKQMAPNKINYANNPFHQFLLRNSLLRCKLPVLNENGSW